MKNAYVFLADGFEEVEAITPIDYLRRAGVSVTIVGVSGRSAVSARKITVECDRTLGEVLSQALPDLVVLPGGGKGSANLAASPELKALVGRMLAEKRLVGAICAAPAVALGAWGYLTGRKYTCYPGEETGLAVKPLQDRVVLDGNLITARAAGVAEEFSLALVRALVGADEAAKVAQAIIAR
jgi:4-methyl-5(b-hydroxyethyl)-thiazole monophosphate biosynthesis